MCPKETALALHDVYNQVRVVAALQDKKLPAWRSKDNPMMEILHTEGMADFEEVLHEEGILDNEIEALLPSTVGGRIGGRESGALRKALAEKRKKLGRDALTKEENESLDASGKKRKALAEKREKLGRDALTKEENEWLAAGGRESGKKRRADAKQRIAEYEEKKEADEGLSSAEKNELRCMKKDLRLKEVAQGQADEWGPALDGKRGDEEQRKVVEAIVGEIMGKLPKALTLQRVMDSLGCTRGFRGAHESERKASFLYQWRNTIAKYNVEIEPLPKEVAAAYRY